MNAFDVGLRRLFNDPNGSLPAVYTPAQQLPVPLRIVFAEPDAPVTGTFTGAKAISQQLTADLLVADVPVKPGAGCTLQVAGKGYAVRSCTQEKSGRIWRVVLSDG